MLLIILIHSCLLAIITECNLQKSSLPLNLFTLKLQYERTSQKNKLTYPTPYAHMGQKFNSGSAAIVTLINSKQNNPPTTLKLSVCILCGGLLIGYCAHYKGLNKYLNGWNDDTPKLVLPVMQEEMDHKQDLLIQAGQLISTD